MAMTYAGIELCLSAIDAKFDAFTQFYHPVDNTPLSSVSRYESAGLLHLPLPPEPTELSTDIGVLSWPTGMMRPATFRGLIGSTQLAQLQASLGTGGSGPANLVLSDDNSGASRTFPMYVVGVRPVLQMEGETFIHILELADQRWHLRTRFGSVSPVSASWSDLFTDIASQLGITLSIDSIASGYDVPTDRWDFDQKPLSLLLDAAAAAVGHRIVANLDGTFSTVNYTTASTASNAQAPSFYKTAGGIYANSDLARSVPASVKVVFKDTATPTLHTETVTLASLALAEYGAATGAAGQQATLIGEMEYDGTNIVAIQAYANQAAADYYLWHLTNLDTTYPSITQWVPTGFEDNIDWTYQLTVGNQLRMLTRVIRPPYQVLSTGGVLISPEQEANQTVLVRVITVTGAIGEYPDSYTVRQVTLDSGGNVDDVDPVQDYPNVVELSGRKLKVSASPTPQEEVYVLGTSSDGQRFVVGFDLGCHLAYDDDRKIEVDVESLAGEALYVSEDDCPTLNVGVGCNMQINEDNEVEVDVPSLAGAGLVSSGTPCPTLSVGEGCGISVSANAVNVDLTDVVVEGLYFDAENCEMGVLTGCNLTTEEVDDGIAIAVDVAALAGNNVVTALVVEAGGDCDNLAFDTDVFSTESITVLTDQKLELVAGKIRSTITKVTLTNSYNAAGVILTQDFGEPVESHTEVDPCVAYECCDAATLTVTSVSGDPNPAGTGDGVTWTPTVTGGVAPYTYLWSFTAGYTLEGESTLTDEIPTVSWATIGSKTGTVIVTDACGNTATNNSSVSVEVGTGGTVSCEECGRALNGTLTANLSGDQGTVSMDWNAVDSQWQGSAVLPCGVTLYLAFSTDCVLYFSCNGDDFLIASTLFPASDCGPPFTIGNFIVALDDNPIGGCDSEECGTLIASVTE